jgi:DNA-binding beta-propeller fold protein YncE
LASIIPIDGTPNSLSIGAGGIWIAEQETDEVLRIDPNSGQIIARIPVQVFDITKIAAGEGGVWVSAAEKEDSSDGGLLHINPINNEIEKYIGLGAPVVDFAFQDGIVWTVSTGFGYSTITRIDPITNDFYTEGEYAFWTGDTKIAANASGLWIVNETNPDLIQHIDPNTKQIVNAANAAKIPGELIALEGNKDAIWALFDSGNIGRIDTSLHEVVSIIPVSRNASNLFFAANNLWSFDPAEAKLYRIDIAQNRVTGSSNAGSQLPTATPTITPTATPIPFTPDPNCRSDYATRLKIGDRAKVSETPPTANRVRAQANLDGAYLGSIYPGEIVEIIDGPICSNNWTWWRIRAEANDVHGELVGWTAEGDKDNYWLVPVTN